MSQSSESVNCIDKMNKLCPNCGQMTNSSFSRLVKDACGHMKCRICLLQEESGCESCRKEHNNPNINNFNFSTFLTKTTESDSSNTNDIVILPLKLEQYSPASNNISKVTQELRNNDENCHETSNHNDSNQKVLTELKTLPPDVLELNTSNLEVLDDTITNVQNNKEDSLSPNKSNETERKRYHNKSHIVIIPGEPVKYQCIVCQKMFKNKKCINYHNSCATGIKPYRCTICDKSFINRSHFEYHERTHTGYKPFKCNLCDKAFPQRNKLNRHMISHRNEKNFACSKCDKKYSKKADLQSHLYVHSSSTNNKYVCKSCGKAFGNITHLKRHVRAHSNERPHICTHCNKGFKDKSLLVRHYKTHGKERPFTCADCSRGFLTKSELRRHLTIHSDEKPFSCIFCQTVFRRKDNLNRHIRHHHSEDEPSSTIQTQTESMEKMNVEKPPVKVKSKIVKSKSKTKMKKQKSQQKASKITFTNSQKQIISRLDSMGNITPVIRMTSEVSNAVPVINGPTVTRRSMESNEVPKKTLTYMEPIPREEAVVINRRIEAKLYPESNLSQNYFFHDFADSNDNLYSNPNTTLRSSLSYSSRISKNGKDSNCSRDAFSCNDAPLENSLSLVPDSHKHSTRKDEAANVICYEEKKYNNYVSTIKKHSAHDV